MISKNIFNVEGVESIYKLVFLVTNTKQNLWRNNVLKNDKYCNENILF